MSKVKKIVIGMFKSLGKMAAVLVSYEFVVLVETGYDYFYSQIIKNSFKVAGKNFHIKSKAYLYGLKHIEIGNDFYCFKGLRLEAFDKHLEAAFTPSVIFGNNISINFDCHIACCNKIVFGNNVLLGSRVFITDHFHGEIKFQELLIPPNQRLLHSPGQVIIEDNVWIGENVSIMPNVTIGKNSIIGANAVVTKCFPKNSIIAGVPAKLIRTIENEE